MITLKKLKWSNVFSYGENNEIDFTKSPITQLVGANGHGKSSIPLILELVLFNKNSKGIKAGSVLNRYVDSNTYKISLSFSKNNDEYTINLNRASTQTVKFNKNGEDISAHTATNTFKLIEEILGFTHSQFVQYIYQSSAGSLEFLTTTDSNRKKFLIEFLNLGRYTELFDIFKEEVKKVSEQVKTLETKTNVVSSWLDKNSNKDLTLKDLHEVPVDTPEKLEEVLLIKDSIKTIVSTNKHILDNNKYKELRDAINPDYLSMVHLPVEDSNPLISEKGVLSAAIATNKGIIAKVSKLHSKCPTCANLLDISKSLELAATAKKEVEEHEAKLSSILEKLSQIEKNRKENEKIQGMVTSFESYSNLIRDDLPTEILSKLELENRVSALTSEIDKRSAEIKLVTKQNQEISAHNATVNVINQQMQEMQTDLKKYREELVLVTKRMTTLQVLQKAFSTSGLPTYKIEGLIKDLENTVNEYLAELSSGRFQLAFVIDGEKLNVVITDNGYDIEISALSQGELARVNVCTLLGLRKTMQQLSNIKVNLLILDEVIENLDYNGKDTFIEMLTREQHLNTFIISHSYSHPLLERLNIIKEDNISRIEC